MLSIPSRSWLLLAMVGSLSHWTSSVLATSVCNSAPTQSKLASRVLVNLIGNGPNQLSDNDRAVISKTFVSIYNQLVNCNNQNGAFRTAVEADILLPQNSTTTSAVSSTQAQPFSVLLQVVVTCSGDCGELFINETTSVTRVRGRRRLQTKLTRRLDPLPFEFPPILPVIDPLPPGNPVPPGKKYTSKSAKAPASKMPASPKSAAPLVMLLPTYSPSMQPVFGGSPAPIAPPPTLMPITSSPTSPITFQPTDAITPMTLQPTLMPITSSPSMAPVTPPPTLMPITSSPSMAPVTPPPTVMPVTSSPSMAPVTPPPTVMPVTSSPSMAPVTPPPTVMPVTSSPSMAPVTPSPTYAPVSPPPTLLPTSAPSPGIIGGQTATPTQLVDCQCGPPDLQAFQLAFRSSLISQGLTDLLGVGQVIPLVPVNCTAPESTFTSFVALGVDGDQANVTQDQLMLVSSIFQNSYNQLNALNSLTCDLQFRVITDVTATANVSPSGLYLTSPSSGRRLTTSSTSSSSYRAKTLNRFILLLTAKGSCRGCKSNPKLYDDTIARRALAAAMSPFSSYEVLEPADHAWKRSLQSNASVVVSECVCPVGNPVFKAPTKSEQQTVANTEIATYVQSGQLTAVTSIQDVTSLVSKDCAPTVSTFETTITIQLGGSASSVNLTADDLLTVVEGFTHTYNAIAEHFCDPFFRSIEATSIVSIQKQRRLSSFSFLALLLKSKGSCRGCKSNTKLFDDTTARRWLSQDLSLDLDVMERRRLQTSGQCFCDDAALANRAPTSGEFSQAFNNFTTNVLDLGVTQVKETPGNTTTGTSTPTIALTASPVPPPTPAPRLSFPPISSGSNVVCVAVIDEASSPPARVLESDWVSFRKAFPDRPFCLLQPIPNPRSDLKIPNEFLTDPSIIYAHVNRDLGNPANTSSWYDICRLGELKGKGVTDVVLYVDNSGSLVTVDVLASYNQFQSDVRTNGDTLLAILESTLENYFLPFLQFFNYTGTFAPVPFSTPAPQIPLTRLPVFSPSPSPVTFVPTSSQIRSGSGGGGNVKLPTAAPVPTQNPLSRGHNVVACIAVIDQTSSSVANKLTPEWASFRNTFPERPFCLLQPVPIQSSELFIPTAFLSDNLATFARVTRDEGQIADASNWFDLCGLSTLKASGITLVALWVDNTGSMTTGSVKASYDMFLSEALVSDFTLVANMNGTTSDDYIVPFYRDFSAIPSSSPVSLTQSPVTPTSSTNFVSISSPTSNSTSSGR